MGVGRRNDGVDIRAPQGTPVKAAAPGEVVYAGNQVPGFGNLVLIKHADGWVTAYAHLDKRRCADAAAGGQGQQVGPVGMTGGLAEPELHFEVRYAPTSGDKARPVDPVLVLPWAGPVGRLGCAALAAMRERLTRRRLDRSGVSRGGCEGAERRRAYSGSGLPSSPARSRTNCQATRPERAPRSCAHCRARRSRSAAIRSKRAA